jgi:CelD/BcsL family acetyltransferase involved in cellulose biosynthesis
LIDKNLNQFDPVENFVADQPYGFGQRLHFAVGASPRLTISNYHDIADISQIWLKFQTHAAATLQQNFQWCNAWQNTVGKNSGCSPRILVGRDAEAKVVFILPLQVRQSWGLTILEWLSYPSVNYGYGLFDRNFLPRANEWFAVEFDNILDAIGPFDVLSLQDLPAKLHGHPHPLLAHANLKAPNRAYAMTLQPDFDALYASKRSLATRKSHRKRDARLKAMGDISFGLPGHTQEAHSILDEMFSHQACRLAQSGIHGVFGKTEREFFHLLIDETNGRDPFLLPYVLKCNGETLAVMLGGSASGTFWPFISSMRPGPTLKHSPGDYVLRHVIAACCTLGLTRLDFASGDSGYKSQWADETINLATILQARNMGGLFWVSALALSLNAKRLIKQNRLILRVVFYLRRLLAGHTFLPHHAEH